MHFVKSKLSTLIIEQLAEKKFLLVENDLDLKSFLDNKRKYEYIILDDILYNYVDDSKEVFAKDIIIEAKKRLLQEGKLIILATNLLSVQLMNGKQSDLSRDYFDGYSFYNSDIKKQYYTRSQWIELLKSTNCANYKFFYPYPNLDYVKEIFSDFSFDKYDYGKNYYNFDSYNSYFFDESRFWNMLKGESVSPVFANAFMIIVSNEELETCITDCEYVKLNWDRDDKFQIATIVNRQQTITKFALTKEAKGHIENLYHNQDKKFTKKVRCLQGKYSDGNIVYPFLDADTLDALLWNAIQKGDKNGFYKLFDSFYGELYREALYIDSFFVESFVKVFGKRSILKKYHCINPANIDLICDNIFVENETYLVIDCEWIFNFYVPVEFIVWRAINELYAKHREIIKYIKKSDLLLRYSIEKEDEDCFVEWNNNFVYNYVQSDAYKNQSVEKKYIDLKDFNNRKLSNKSIQREIYLDTVQGIDEAHPLLCDLEKKEQNHYRLSLSVTQNLVGRIFRWKPLPTSSVSIKINEIKGLRMVGHNAVEKSDGFDFIMEDGYFFFEIVNSHFWIDLDVSKLSISKRYSVIKNKENEKLLQIRELKSEIDNLKAENERLIALNNQVKQDYQSVINSTIWRKTSFLRKIKDRKKNKEKERKECINEVEERSSIDFGVPNCMYNIDDVIVDAGDFCVRGWVVFPEKRIAQPRLILENEFGIRHTLNMELYNRDDVKKGLHVNFYGKCGVSIGGEYLSSLSQKIIISVVVDGQTQEIDTGRTVPPVKNAPEGTFYVNLKSTQNKRLNYWNFRVDQCIDYTNSVKECKVDIIIPVYNGFDYLPTLFETLEKTEQSYRLIIVDDCSPDEKVFPFLNNYKQSHDNVILLSNESNLGFVRSVNRALDYVQNHVVLLNTDVELPDNWLERLIAPFFVDSTIASATPYTNSGTVMSFPVFCEDNSMFMNLNVNEIDNVFQTIKPRYTEMPTGVGFCMGMNYRAIKGVGKLDDDTFELGYGEENDWCQRVIQAGYKNVSVENLFVHHNHGGSFASEKKKALMKKNAKKLLEKHPNYEMDVATFCKMDPNRDIRDFVAFTLLLDAKKDFVLVFNHDLGGGADAYLRNQKCDGKYNDIIFCEVRFSLGNQEYYVELSCDGVSAAVSFEDEETLFKLLKTKSYKEIWINELVTYPNIFSMLSKIVQLRRDNSKFMKLMIHDYYMICPSLNLLNEDGVYCGVSNDFSKCNSCILSNRFVCNVEEINLESWRNKWQSFLNSCDEIIAFSESSIKILKAAYLIEGKYKVEPHTIEPLRKVQKHHKQNSGLTIGILGAISEIKGLNVIKKMLKYIEEEKEDIKIVIIGETSEEISDPNLIVNGRYERNEIVDLTESYDIDCFMIPSICPETFSYTTSEIISMDMPLAVFDIGAPVERVSKYSKGLILGKTDMQVAKIIKEIKTFLHDLSINSIT